MKPVRYQSIGTTALATALLMAVKRKEKGRLAPAPSPVSTL